MSRKTKNRDLMNQNLFKILFDYLDDFNLPVDIDATRWIKLEENDKKWCKGIDIITSFNLLPRISSAILDYNGNKYLVLTGFEKINQFDPELELEEIEINAGQFLTIVNELNVPLKKGVDKLEIYNDILSQHESPNYSGHSYTDLILFFENIYAYKINQSSLLWDYSLERIDTYVLYNNAEELFLDFSEETMGLIYNLILQFQDNLPYHYICRSLLSIQWKDAFLEVYRCIESIFHLEALNELHKEIQTPLSIEVFSSLLDNEIGYKPKEEHTLEMIFSKVNDIPKNLVNNLKAPGETKMREHRWFYKLRNSFVHSRPSMEEIKLDNSQWDELIQATLHILEQWHKLNKDLLKEI